MGEGRERRWKERRRRRKKEEEEREKEEKEREKEEKEREKEEEKGNLSFFIPCQPQNHSRGRHVTLHQHNYIITFMPLSIL